MRKKVTEIWESRKGINSFLKLSGMSENHSKSDYPQMAKTRKDEPPKEFLAN